MAIRVNVRPAAERSFIRPGTLQQLLAFGGLLLLIVFFTATSKYFLTARNLIDILLATAVNGILALGVTFVIITGGIDLSIGTVMSLSAVMTAVFITNWQLPVIVGLIGGLGTGALAGFINGVIIAKLKIPPFIATLGMLNVAKGLALVIANVHPIYFDDSNGFHLISLGSIVGGIFPGQPWLQIPNAVLILFGSAILGAFVLARTVLGRYTFALGSNEEATRLSGVNVDRWKILVYVVCGLFAGLAGIIISARLDSAQPATGQGYELNAIAAAVIGGTSLAGGEGTILGTIIGALFLSVLNNGLLILSVPDQWQTVITGVIVVLAVFLDVLRRRRQPGGI